MDCKKLFSPVEWQMILEAVEEYHFNVQLKREGLTPVDKMVDDMFSEIKAILKQQF